MVGKSDQAHTEGIALGSDRMLTLANGSPSACNTCAARLEKPHCAAFGSPFMNRTSEVLIHYSLQFFGGSNPFSFAPVLVFLYPLDVDAGSSGMRMEYCISCSFSLCWSHTLQIDIACIGRGMYGLK